MKTKHVQQILTPPSAYMVGDGFRVHNFFPGGHTIDERRMSPFFLLDYNSKIEFPPSSHQRGVGPHPHRGFETVTIAYHGKVAHHDSLGNSGIIGEGDVQWMTAGSGILHKEYHEKEFSNKGGLFQMVQLWVNLPAKNKMTKPKYQTILNSQMGVYPLDDNGKVEVIAGTYKNVKGPASTFTPIELYNIHLKKNNVVSLEFPAQYNTGILVIEGMAHVNDSEYASTDNFILFKNDGERIELQAKEDCILLLMSGQPINEPIVAYGPFLMNTKEEITQAYDDVNNGKFGYLED